MPKKLQIRLLVLLSGGFFVYSLAEANNIQVSGAAIAGRNTEEKYALVQFDISWENSWRIASAPNNWDAAWVFLKCRRQGGDWQHALLNDAGHSAPAGSALEIGLLEPESAFDPVNNPGLGILLYRNTEGSGTFSAEGIEVRWNFGANGLSNEDVVDIVVFAVEMVYVPAGSFYVGSGGTELGSFTNGSWTSGATIPYQITSEAAITIGPSSGNLWGTSSSGTSTIGSSGTLPAEFPKGYQSFYCMKHEITQGMYVDFLNHLNRAQQLDNLQDLYYTTANQAYVMVGHTPFHTKVDRNSIRCNYPIPADGPIHFYCDLNGNGDILENDGYNLACNYLLRDFFLAYLDWAALRPMTELEFEKACRGTAAPTANQYAWGNSTIKAFSPAQKYQLTNEGKMNEKVTNADTTSGGSTGNALYENTVSATVGPFRAGIFARTGTGRITAGASFWGILDLTGNLREYTVTTGHDDGRAFTGNHGDGMLSPEGKAESSWPSDNGVGLRGGGYGSYTIISQNDLLVSSRYWAVGNGAGNRNWNGGRGVRTAP